MKLSQMTTEQLQAKRGPDRWMLEPNGDRPLNEAEARALLCVSGKEVTE